MLRTLILDIPTCDYRFTSAIIKVTRHYKEYIPERCDPSSWGWGKMGRLKVNMLSFFLFLIEE